MIVVDASVAIEVLLRTRRAPRIESQIFADEVTLHAPHLLDVEVAQVLRRYAAMKEIEAERALEALTDLADLPLERYPHQILLPRIWELRGNLTAYDAAYVALAEALDATLLSSDRHLANAPGHRARIALV
jgi:predicted nucleic acid-binding protein